MLRLLLLLLVLLVGRVGAGDVEDVVAILLWVLRLIMGRSVGGIGRLSGALLRLVMMGVVLVLRRGLGRVGHERCEFLGEVHGWLRRVRVRLAEGFGEEVGHEHIVWIKLGLGWGGRHRWRRGREMKSLLPDLRFIGRSGIKGH